MNMTMMTPRSMLLAAILLTPHMGGRTKLVHN
jgi:hypothetical protein